MAGRRYYTEPWYKRNERAFTDALAVRFQMILDGDTVLPRLEFVALVFPKRPQFHAGLAVIVDAIDRRAQTCRSPLP